MHDAPRKTPYPQATARISGHPLHSLIVPFPLVFFISALASDLLFLGDGDPFWARASRTLLIGGLATAPLAALAGFTDFIGSREMRLIGKAWAHMIGNVTAISLEILNLLLRLGEAAPGDSIYPLGVALSGMAAAILAFTGWAGGELVYRHGAAVRGDKFGTEVGRRG